MQRRRGKDPRMAKWTLCVRPGEFPSLEAYKDPTFQKLLTSGDFTMEVLGPAAAGDLWARHNWGREPHWVLLSPTGEETARGTGRPKGEAVLDAIHGTGAMPRWEAREAFLKSHPGQGEARLEELNQAFQLLRVRLLALDKEGKVRIPVWHGDRPPLAGFVPPRISLPPGTFGEAMADEYYGGVADALEKLLAVPGWEREAGTLAAHLTSWDMGQSFRLRKLFTQAARGLQDALRKDPYDGELANFWMEVTDAAGLDSGNLAGLCVPVPGWSWPEPSQLSRFLEPCFRRKDLSGILRLLSDLAPQGPPEPMTAYGWESYCRLQSALLAQKGLALAGLGSWDLAGSALAEARHWGGSQGVREALVTRGSLFTGPDGDPNAWRQILGQALGRESETPVMPAVQAPLRLVVSGMPKWIVAWTALRNAAELAPWAPSELRWEVANQTSHDQLRARHGWSPGPRWLLYRGEELRLSGQTCPDARALAATLEGEGLTMLQRLQRVLDGQPDHLGARRERFDLLLKRMPDRRLEATLAQDAARALIILEFDLQAPWKPDPSLWAEAAQMALPHLEEAIRSWPNRAYLWRAWVSWARFHPAQPSVLALAQSVAFWTPRSDWRAWLPFEVQRAVAAEMRRQGDFGTMREWFRTIWETLDHRPLRQLHVAERQWVTERRRQEETAVFQPLRDALTALQCTQEQAELEQIFGEMMGRESRRP